VGADVGWVGGGAVALDEETAATVVVAHEHVLVIALSGVVAVLDPLLLDELELAGDAGVESHEDDAAVVGVGGGLVFGGEGAVGQAAAGDAAAVDEAAVEAEGVAGMNAADVGAEGAAGAFGVCGVGEVGAAVGILCGREVGGVGGELEGGAVAPAADELGGEFFFGGFVSGGVVARKVARFWWSLR